MKVIPRLARWASFRDPFRSTCRVPSRRAAPLPRQLETHFVLSPSVLLSDYSDYCRYSTPSSPDTSVLDKKRVVGQPNVLFRLPPLFFSRSEKLSILQKDSKKT